MTHFFAKAVRAHAAKNGHDSLDLLLHVKKIVRERGAIDESTFRATSLDGYVVPLGLPSDWEKEMSARSKYLVGRLDLLPARLDAAAGEPPDRDYLERLASLDLQGIFSEGGLGHRFGGEVRRFLENVRFSAPGDLVYTLREHVQAAYDLILVDSRTGLNEISGLCIGPLCDALVVCTGLNEQNVEGTRYFMRQAGLFDKERAKPYAVVVGPVPPWTRVQTDARLKKVSEALQIQTLDAVPYHPAAALGEPIFVVDDPSEAIASAYRGMANRIPQLARLPEAREEPHRKMESEASHLSAVRRNWRGLASTHYAPMFPSAAAIWSIVGNGGRHRDAASVLAAVTACYLESPEPFLRLYESREGSRDEDSVSSLVLLRLRVLWRVPFKAKGADRWVVKFLEDDVPRSGDLFSIAFAYARSLGVARGFPRKVPRSTLIGSRLSTVFRMIESLFRGLLPYEIFESPAFEVASEYLFEPGLPDSVRATIGKFAHSKDLLDQIKGEKHLRLSADHFDYPVRHYGPVFSPVPLMISFIALVKGAAAADELVDWIALCRRVHGYAWRVLVDWRHLAGVRENPRLQALMKEEDEQVARIERAIDCGEYPL